MPVVPIASIAPIVAHCAYSQPCSVYGRICSTLLWRSKQPQGQLPPCLQDGRLSHLPRACAREHNFPDNESPTANCLLQCASQVRALRLSRTVLSTAIQLLMDQETPISALIVTSPLRNSSGCGATKTTNCLDFTSFKDLLMEMMQDLRSSSTRCNRAAILQLLLQSLRKPAQLLPHWRQLHRRHISHCRLLTNRSAGKGNAVHT